MSDATKRKYSLVQLRELDDAAIAGGFGDTLEARFAGNALECERIGLSLQRFKPGVRDDSGHRHSNDEEIYVVVSGGGRAVVEARSWSCAHGMRCELRPATHEHLRPDPMASSSWPSGPTLMATAASLSTLAGPPDPDSSRRLEASHPGIRLGDARVPPRERELGNGSWGRTHRGWHRNPAGSLCVG